MKRHQWSGCVLTAVFVLAQAAALAMAQGTMGAEPKLPPVKFTDQRLANGLRVIIAVDHTAPVFGIDVCYNTGSRNERPGRTGFAHLFEHMMFEGSENVGKGEHFILVLNNGGNMNGTTNSDRTTYFESLPKNQLDLALFLESDRMGKLAVNQANLDNQRNAVQEERRLGVDNQPYGKAFLDIDNLAYDNFAYKHSTIGEMSDLNAADLQDVKDFFRTYYAPNNAVLTLVGDLDPAVTLEKVKKYFGGIPSQPAPPPVSMTEPEHYGERTETIMDPLARTPLLIMAYHIPAGNTADNWPFQVLQQVLGTGESSRLYQHLVKEKQLATQVFVNADFRRGPSLFYIYAFLRPGVKPEDAEKVVLDDIATVQKDGITSEELEKARTQFLTQEIQQNRPTDLGTAIEIGDDAVNFNDPNLINTQFDKYDAVTADQVKAAAQKYLIDKELAVVTDLPVSPAGGSAAAGK
ncbi:MAG TPA: pitrilysin family protein [Terriglobia bacterium]|nr:pitrilysin family protein [Terriglobia bacterium]